MVMAAASTARPASCPPIRRGSSGKVDAVGLMDAASWRDRCLAVGLGVELGVTTGKRLDRLVGDTTGPGSGGNIAGGGKVGSGAVATGVGLLV